MKQQLKVVFTGILILLFNHQHAASQSFIDSAKEVVRKAPAEEIYVKTCFFIADAYMDLDQYDSAQVWLNKIADRLPLKKPSLFNYFLSSRQAEVYYYNGLQRLGLQESERSMSIAKALNDSVLLADGYNFTGLFYMNLDSNRKSIDFYSAGMKYARQPPYPPQYFSLTKPHHLYGNQAEAYLRLGVYDSSLILAKKSLELAAQIKWQRGMAVACNTLGQSFYKMQQYDSAAFYHNKGQTIAKQSGDIDVELICYGGLGIAAAAKNEKTGSFTYFEKGFDLLGEKPFINSLFYLRFLDDAINIYQRYNEKDLLVFALQKKANLESNRLRKNDLQINTLLNAGLKNETRLLALEVADATQKQQLAGTRFMLALGALVLLIVLFFIYRYNQNQKLEVSKIRQKISQDLHDDIGASLSSLQIYGTIAEQQMGSNPQKAIEMVNKINVQSRLIMENMSDIVWSMKTSTFSHIALETRIKNYASDLLQDKNIELACVIQPEAEQALESIHARKNILLIVKEVLNNMAKYSEAEHCTLHAYVQDKTWVLHIADDGKGFDTGKQQTGNGIRNIKARCSELKGTCSVITDAGTEYLMVFPLTVINDSGWQ